MIKTFKEVLEIRKIPQIWHVASFLVLSGLLAPSFATFWYYFNRGVRGFS